MINRAYCWDLRTANTYPSAHQLDFFSTADCERTVALGLARQPIESYVGLAQQVDNRIRKNRVVFFDPQDAELRWIFERVAAGIRAINQQFWQFDLTMIETLQFTQYDRPSDFYAAHMDMSHGRTEQRKLGFSIQLSDPLSYTGSNLEFHSVGDDFYGTVRDQGAIIVFPSYMVHRVTPVESGARYSLVGWVVGPPYR